MWLQNDVLITSTVYQHLPQHRQEIVRLAVEALRFAPGNAAARLLGLAEFVNPSIYCIARKADDSFGMASRHRDPGLETLPRRAG
jgi:hypothetical protein